MIRNLVDSYRSIVNKATLDIIPKTIMYYIINNLKLFLENDIISDVFASADLATLMEENAEEELRRKEILKIYHSTKEALSILNEVSVMTISKSQSSNVKSYDQPENFQT